MHRVAALSNDILADPLRAAAMVLASFFVVASVSVGMIFAWDEARTMPAVLAFVLMLVVLAAELYKSLYLSVTVKARRWGAALLGLPIMIVACAYSVTANNRTMERYFGKHEWHTMAESPAYTQAKADADGIARRLAAFQDTRPTGAIRADIKGKLALPGIGDCNSEISRVQILNCPQVVALRVELANATERDRLESLLAEAKTRLGIVQDTATGAGLGPIGRLLAGWGIYVSTFSELIGLIFTALVEGGSVIAPAVLVGGRRPVRTLPAPMANPAPPRLAPPTEVEMTPLRRDYGDPGTNQIALFFEERTERRRGCKLSALLAWEAFEEWCQTHGKRPLVPQNQFWKLVAEELRLVREKGTSVDGQTGRRYNGQHYIGITLLPPRHPAATLLQLVRSPFAEAAS